mgnify:CR=1 FL=1
MLRGKVFLPFVPQYRFRPVRFERYTVIFISSQGGYKVYFCLYKSSPEFIVICKLIDYDENNTSILPCHWGLSEFPFL